MTETAGQRIKRRRIELGYSNQFEFCKRFGIAQSTLSELERGESKLPSAKHMVLLTSALKVSDSWILYGHDGGLKYPTDDDAKILDALNSLTAEQKRAVYDIVMGLAKK